MNGFGMSAPPSFSMGSPMPFAGSLGANPVMMSPYGGFCPICCHPIAMCCCNIRQCRKEAKELLVTPQAKQAAAHTRISAFTISADTTAAEADVFSPVFSELMRFMKTSEPTGFSGASEPTEETTDSEGNRKGNPGTAALTGTAAGLTASATPGFTIAPTSTRGMGVAFIGGGCCVHLSIEYMSTNANSLVLVLVLDSEGTVLGWMKTAVKPGYYIKEGIISTKPGAILGVSVSNIIARVRWCEVFSG